MTPFGHEFLDLGDRPAGIEVLGARVRAIQDRMTTIKSERILQRVQPLPGRFIAAID